MEKMFHCYYVDTSLLLSDIYPTQFGEQMCEPNYGFGPCIRNHYILHYVYEGKGILKTNGHTYHLKKGELFLIYPGQLSYYKADSDEPWLYRWIEFNGSICNTMMQRAGFSKTSPIISDDENAKIGHMLKQIVAQGEIDFDSHMSNFWTFLSLLSSRTNDSIFASRQEQYITKAEKYIKMNLHRNIRISELSHYLGIDRSYLSRLFKQYNGVSTQQFILAAKLDAASQYLKNKTFSVAEIAGSVGYSDPLEFSKAFKKRFKLSPTNWRKEFLWEQSVKEFQ